MLLRSTPVDAVPARDTPRRPLRNNPRRLVLFVLLLVGVLVGLFVLAGRTSLLEPGALSEAVFYALYPVDMLMLAVILFVLARNIFKLWVERREAVPFARFRGKLVAALLALTIVPAGLLLIVGSQFIHSSAERWFSEPVEGVLDAGRAIARQYYAEHRDAAVARATRVAHAAGAQALRPDNEGVLRRLLTADVAAGGAGLIELYRAVPSPSGPQDAQMLVGVESPAMPRGIGRASADRLAAHVVASGQLEAADDESKDGILIRAAAPVIGENGKVVGVVVVSEALDSAVTAEARLATTAYEQYKQLQVWKVPLQSLYLAFFVMVALLILISATWLGPYVAKRITRPVQMLAEGARAIGAGQLDYRLEVETNDEFGALVQAFNVMAEELHTSQQTLERSRVDLEHTNAEVDARRRYIETILERVATGVISITADGRLSTINGAAERLLGIDASAIGADALTVFAREDLQPLLPMVEATGRREAGGLVQEITLAREDREVHLAVAETTLSGEDGRPEGAVMVLDDVTPLIRAQRVAAWRDVARRLAHEIKNPLTPIQLSAERLRRNFATAPPNARALVDECTGAIVAEVEALKGLVDEFAQFARMRGPRTAPTDLNRLIADTLHLYDGVLQQGRLNLAVALAVGLPLTRVDGEQMRQVIINLVDNAMEALGGPSAPPRPTGEPATIIVATEHDSTNRVVRLTITDNGPGVPAADREKLFMPYYSTKGRGSGLGLAIVRRIVAEHGGAIDVTDAQPTGTRVTVELPVG